MYGLINQAIEDLVTEKFGEERWEEIKSMANVYIPHFSAIESYDDKITYDLVAAASKALELTPEQVLEAFGVYWVTYTAQKGYANYFKAGGKTFKEFILNLNDLHAKIEDIFPDFRPPKFVFTKVENNLIELKYLSTREGLAPMLRGLFKGVGDMFDSKIEITHFPKDDKREHDEFKLEF